MTTVTIPTAARPVATANSPADSATRATPGSDQARGVDAVFIDSPACWPAARTGDPSVVVLPPWGAVIVS